MDKRAKTNLRQRELEMHLRVAVLDLMEHLDVLSFALQMASDGRGAAYYVVVGDPDQIGEHVTSIREARPPPDQPDPEDWQH